MPRDQFVMARQLCWDCYKGYHAYGTPEVCPLAAAWDENVLVAEMELKARSLS
jgi:predicted metal-binding protein